MAIYVPLNKQRHGNLQQLQQQKRTNSVCELHIDKICPNNKYIVPYVFLNFNQCFMKNIGRTLSVITPGDVLSLRQHRSSSIKVWTEVQCILHAWFIFIRKLLNCVWVY